MIGRTPLDAIVSGHGSIPQLAESLTFLSRDPLNAHSLDVSMRVHELGLIGCQSSQGQVNETH